VPSERKPPAAAFGRLTQVTLELFFGGNWYRFCPFDTCLHRFGRQPQGDGAMVILGRDTTFVEHHASLADYRERVFRLRSEIWRLVDGSREAIAQSSQLIVEAEAALARGSDRSPAKPKLCDQLDFTQEANACFRLIKCENHAGIRAGWLTLADPSLLGGRGSAHSKCAGLLPIEPSDEFVSPADLKKDQSPNRQSSLGRRALRVLAQFLVTFCVLLDTILAWRSDGNIAGQMTANLYRQLGWLALTSERAPNVTAVAASVAPYPAQQQLDVDRVASGQQQMTRETDQTATSITQAASAQTGGIAAESRTDGSSLQPTVRLDIKPTEVRLPQTLSERGKQLSAASGGHDASCFPSASAVLQNHPRGWPSWTLRAAGHEGTLCWYAAARPRGSDHRPRGSDHRSEMMPTEKEIVGATQN
jgi:hypothetical protein